MILIRFLSSHFFLILIARFLCAFSFSLAGVGWSFVCFAQKKCHFMDPYKTENRYYHLNSSLWFDHTHAQHYTKRINPRFSVNFFWLFLAFSHSRIWVALFNKLVRKLFFFVTSKKIFLFLVFLNCYLRTQLL